MQPEFSDNEKLLWIIFYAIKQKNGYTNSDIEKMSGLKQSRISMILNRKNKLSRTTAMLISFFILKSREDKTDPYDFFDKLSLDDLTECEYEMLEYINANGKLISKHGGTHSLAEKLLNFYKEVGGKSLKDLPNK